MTTCQKSAKKPRVVGAARGRPSAEVLEIAVPRGHPEKNRMTPAPHPATRPMPPDMWQPRTCQFPEGDPGEAGFHFCGAAVQQGSSYCPEHYRRCYLPPKRREGDGPAADFQWKGWGGRGT